jgi:quercetin dioxygenase-like cupin family protein
MAHVVKAADLAPSGGARRFEGGPYGADLSLFLVDSEPGQGPDVHRHPYAEVLVVRRGHVQLTVDGTTLAAEAGDIVVVEAGTAHGFVNAGPGPLEMITIHAAGGMVAL